MTDKFKKKLLTLRQLLIGSKYFEALAALEFAAKFHTGKRKGGDPEFEHQVSIALYALTLPFHPSFDIEAVLAVIMLHDVREDYDVSDLEIRAIFIDADFANKVANAVDKMTKVFRGIKKDEILLFEVMAMDELASIAKLCDRIHNLQTMVGVFTIPKMEAYLKEVEELFLPMLKKAKRQFPHNTVVYENLKHMIMSQVELIEAVVSSQKKE